MGHIDIGIVIDSDMAVSLNQGCLKRALWLCTEVLGLIQGKFNANASTIAVSVHWGGPCNESSTIRIY